MCIKLLKTEYLRNLTQYFLHVLYTLPIVIIQGKLFAVAYTLRTYGNQFSLGGICKQEYSISVRFYVKDGSHVRLRHPSCVYITAQRQYTAVQKMRSPLK